MRTRRALPAALTLAALTLAALSLAYVNGDAAERARIDLGHAVFNTQWVPAGTAGAARRDGLGPLFNAAACDACHNEGAHGRGPSGEGLAPAALVVQLEVRRRGSARNSAGDARYGRTFNTAAIEGVSPEGIVNIHYEERSGRYADGAAWHLRTPRYVLSGLERGPLGARTIIEPRLAPQLFGIGLLEAVPAIPAGRFGWQSESTSIRDQTTKAFARDMGLTTVDRAADDCTAAEPECRAAPNGGTPEVSEEFLDAVVEFQRTLAIPRAAATYDGAWRATSRLFARLGCSACHRPVLPVVLPQGRGRGTIAPYTDLTRHDLGAALADRDVSGRIVPSRWRTAPLWGMAYRLENEGEPTFLHDGRARSIEEAILWHDAEASAARYRFAHLAPERRARLLKWIGTL